MSDKELVTQFFREGYQNKNYCFILKCLSEDYIDHSPAGASSNQEAVNILIAVSKMFSDMQITIADVFSENGMVAVRVRYKAVHTGECMGFAATGRSSWTGVVFPFGSIIPAGIFPVIPSAIAYIIVSLCSKNTGAQAA